MEGKRNTSQARGRGGPSFLRRPFSHRARFPSGGPLVLLKPTPGAGVRARGVPSSWEPSVWGERWGLGVTMRYWGCWGRGGGAPEWRTAAQSFPARSTFPMVSAGSD